MGRTLNQTVNEFKEGEAGQQFKKEFEDLHTRIRNGEVTTRVRDDGFARDAVGSAILSSGLSESGPTEKTR